MKTPRDILFERHRHATPKLDDIRQKAIAALPTLQNADARHPVQNEKRIIWTMLRNVWEELIWPSRRAWSGMAALWLLVLAANLQMKATSRTNSSAPAREVAQAVEEQRRMLAELVQPLAPTPMQAPRPNTRPRSERPAILKSC
ncbi:MAG: hypothetical protein JWM68_197 [Verrucomicrobiales bacterium]|nr:hypothetical protein [Verrucomicrobiales bacterium]